MISEDIQKIYGGKIRVRVCGILTHQQKVLLLNHTGLNEENTFWNFPGGGIDAGENVVDTLKREFREETNLEVEVNELAYINEHIFQNLHAVELYFRVSSRNFDATLGFDPELNILAALKWFNKIEIDALPISIIPNFIKDIVFR